MQPAAAIVSSVETRTRPIIMSALTSIFGMLPLVLMSGAGSELYRGIGSVVVGGLLFSTIFTLFVVPALFSLALEYQTRWHRATAALPAIPARPPAQEPQPIPDRAPEAAAAEPQLRRDPDQPSR